MALPTANASNDMVWKVVKGHSAYTVKSNGMTLTKERNNCLSVHSHFTCGFLQKAVGVSYNKNRISATRATRDCRHPRAMTQTVSMPNNNKEVMAKKMEHLQKVNPALAKIAARKAELLIRRT